MTKNDRQIKKVAIIGMGALGMMYADLLSQAANCQLAFIMDHDRFARAQGQVFSVNGKKRDFILQTPASAQTPDLLLLATKYEGLAAALDLAGQIITEKTIIMSLLNGISSEELIAERFGWQQLLGCVAIGMDAMREDYAVTYTKTGRLQIGLFQKSQEPLLAVVSSCFASAGLAYTIEADIRHALWAKFMLNVGINQACMVFATSYGGALQSAEIFQSMTTAMQEVILLANREGVALGQADLQRSIAILRTLNPAGYPSMRQDALAGRPSEVELFSGTVLQLAARHKLPVPVNEFYYRTIRQMEKT